MKSLFTLIVASLIAVGCAGTNRTITAEVVMRHGTNEIRILQPKDTSFKDFMIAPDGTIRIKDYRSTANEAAIAAAERDAEFKNQMLGLILQRADQRIDQVGVPAARAYGLPVQPLAPMQVPAYVHPNDSVVVTNAIAPLGR